MSFIVTTGLRWDTGIECYFMPFNMCPIEVKSKEKIESIFNYSYLFQIFQYYFPFQIIYSYYKD